MAGRWCCASDFRRAASGTTSSNRIARYSSTSASYAATWSTARRLRAKRSITSDWPAATVLAPTCGRNFSAGFVSRKSSSSMLRPKAISRFTTAKAGSVRSAGYLRSSSIACRWRWSSSISIRKSRYATTKVSASAVRPTKPARRSVRYSATEQMPPAASKAMRTRPPPKERSCATCSSTATHGFVPAT